MKSKILGVLFSVFVAHTIALAAIPTTPVSPTGTNGVKILMYNEFTGGTPLDGPTNLSGTASYNNTGSLKAALDSGNFMGVSDASILFRDANSNVEQFNILNGVGFYETVPASPLHTISLQDTNNFFAGADLISSSNLKNSSIIDTYDDGVAMLTASGTLSTYHIGTRTLLNNYTWKTFSGGGAIDGKTLTQALADKDIVGIENGYFLTLNAVGTGFQLYTLLGTFANPAWSVVTPLSGGPLAGKTLKESVQNDHAVAGITFLGIAEADLVFFNSTTGSLVLYNHALLNNTWVGSATTLAAANLTGGGEFSGLLSSAITSGRLLGINDCEINMISSTGNLQQYNCLTGALVWNLPLQPLEGPQALKAADNADFIDTMDSGYVFKDKDNTTSVYINSTKLLYNDEIWKTFTSGDLDGQAPSKANILATEDLLYYAVENDNTLTAYLHTTGAEWPADLWAWTNFTGGKLDGESLSDAVSGKVPGVKFLGIAADQLVFAVSTDPGINITNIATTTESGGSATANVTLNSQPINGVDVVVNLKVSGTQATSTPATLTFTSVNYNVPQIVNIAAIDDNAVEGPHFDFLGYTASSTDLNYHVLASTSARKINIIDNDISVQFENVLASQLEGNATAGATNLPKLLVTGTVLNGTSKTVNVIYTSGTATSTGLAADFVNATSSVTIPAGNYDGSTTTAIAINNPVLSILGDTAFEVSETILLRLATSSWSNSVALGTTTNHIYTLTNDDLPSSLFVELSTTTASNAEGDVGTTALTNFPRLLLFGNAASDSTVEVNINGATSTVYIPAGVYNLGASTTISLLTVIGNYAVGANQVFNVSVQNPTGVAVVADSDGNSMIAANSVFTVLEDDTPIVLNLSFTSLNQSEASSTLSAFPQLLITGTVKATTTVSLLVATSSTATVTLDFIPNNEGTGQTKTIYPGVYDGSTTTALTFSAIPSIVDDTIYEGNETVVYRLQTTDPVPQIGTQSTFTLNIIDNEVAPVTSGGGGSSGGVVVYSGGGGGGFVFYAPQSTSTATNTLTSVGVLNFNGNTCGPKLTSYIKIGKNNKSSDVELLQKFLNKMEGEKLQVTGLYNKETYNAVVRYQVKYPTSVLGPWKLNRPTGYVYITTAKHINERMCAANGYYRN